MAILNLRFATLKLFGRIPKTETLEARDKALREEYERYKLFSRSEDYIRYAELKKFVDSGEPQRIKEELRVLKYPNSPEQMSELEYKKLSKNPKVKNYLKVKGSQDLETYKRIELTGKPAIYKELQQVVESPEYKNHRAEHKRDNSDDFQKEIEYKKLKGDPDIKKYLSLVRSKHFQDFFELENSKTLKQFLELERTISDTGFIERKRYLLSKDKFQKSEAYEKLKEYEELKNSQSIKWFHSLERTKKFDEIKRWECTFSDDFSENSLNMGHWLTRYFWGEAMLNKSYSLASDKHHYNDTHNIEVSNGVLKILTRREKADGLAWDQRYGFVPKQFDYTSGIINSGQSFRQQFGKFEAKLRFSNTPGVYHAFWLVGDKMLPHIDVVRKEGSKGSKVFSSLMWENGVKAKPMSIKSSLGGLNFENNFFILSIEWTPLSIVWKINGVTYMETRKNLPDCPVYLVLSSGVSKEISEGQLPATLEVDWVRCWKEVEEK